MNKPATLPEWKQYLAQRFDDSQFLALATTSAADGAWANPVFFNFDDTFTLYFISEPSCVHMENIEHDPRVSAAIYSTAQDPHGKVKGVQLIGKASWVSAEEAEAACAVYFKQTPARTPISQASRAQEYVRPDAVWRLAKIVPDMVWVFDEEAFGGTRVRVAQEVLGR